LAFPSAQAIGERGFDVGRRVQRAEHGDRFDRRRREIGRDVVGDDGEAKHANAEPFPCRLNGFEVPAGEGPQAQFEGQARSGFLRDILMPRQLIADRGTNEVGAIGIEAVADQKVDRPEVDEPEVDRELLAIGRLRQLLGL